MLRPDQRTHVPFVNMMRGEAAAVFEAYSRLPEQDKAKY
jgi:hypothetical protein